MTRVETAPQAEWLDPGEHTPPRGTKLMLLTRWGIATFGQWDSSGDFVGWSPLPKVPSAIKAKMS